MNTFEYVIKDEVGIHARPAGLLVKEAKQYGETILLECNGKSADVKKLMALMALGVKKGDTVKITVEGENEAEVAANLQEFFQNNL